MPERHLTHTDRESLLAGIHKNPHHVLGAHTYDDVTVLRTLKPGAERVSAVIGDEIIAFDNIGGGLWQLDVPYTELHDYRLWIRYPHKEIVIADGYRFLPTLGDLDLHLIGEGRHEKLWDVLGSHSHSYQTLDGEVTGTSFAVWAPHAQGVCVTGTFNMWDRISHPMRMLGNSGIWELFLPEVGPGEVYKYSIITADGTQCDKADPMARYSEKAPETGSIVYETTYTWNDNTWISNRTESPVQQPMSIYEVHLGSWIHGLTYRELAHKLTEYVHEHKFTHVEFLPVAEHPFGGSWGYQVTSYYAPTSRYGTPDDFKYLIDHLHQAGIGVLIDWVPAHFPKDSWALARFDGTALYEHADPQRGEQPDWGTYVFDFGDKHVRNFLVANAIYWFDQFHIDGLRVDAVASMLYLDYSRPDGQWTPNAYGGRENLEAVQFLQEVNGTVHKLFTGISTIAEESTAWPGVTRPTNEGGLGFTMKWNMGWMHDTLDYFSRDPIHRGFHHHEITFSLVYAWSENFLLPLSHDEVVHAKGSLWNKLPGNSETKAAHLRTLFSYQWSHPGKQLIFMGQEFGQIHEWGDNRSLDWHDMKDNLHAGVARLVKDLNALYISHPALWSLDHKPEGYSWIEPNDAANNVISFLRYGSHGQPIACVFNLSGLNQEQYRLGLPIAGTWTELLNSDATLYGGSGVGNLGEVHAEADHGWHSQPHSAEIVIPAYTAIWLIPAEGV